MELTAHRTELLLIGLLLGLGVWLFLTIRVRSSLTSGIETLGSQLMGLMDDLALLRKEHSSATATSLGQLRAEIQEVRQQSKLEREKLSRQIDELHHTLGSMELSSHSAKLLKLERLNHELVEQLCQWSTRGATSGEIATLEGRVVQLAAQLNELAALLPPSSDFRVLFERLEAIETQMSGIDQAVENVRQYQHHLMEKVHGPTANELDARWPELMHRLRDLDEGSSSLRHILEARPLASDDEIRTFKSVLEGLTSGAELPPYLRTLALHLERIEGSLLELRRHIETEATSRQLHYLDRKIDALRVHPMKIDLSPLTHKLEALDAQLQITHAVVAPTNSEPLTQLTSGRPIRPPSNGRPSKTRSLRSPPTSPDPPPSRIELPIVVPPTSGAPEISAQPLPSEKPSEEAPQPTNDAPSVPHTPNVGRRRGTR